MLESVNVLHLRWLPRNWVYSFTNTFKIMMRAMLTKKHDFYLQILILGSWIGAWKNLRCQLLPTWYVCVCVCVCVFILTAYDRPQFFSWWSFLQTRKGLALLWVCPNDHPFLSVCHRSSWNSSWDENQYQGLCNQCCTGRARFIRTLNLSRLWLNIRV